MPIQLASAIKAARQATGSSSPLASLRGRLILVTAVLAVTAALMVLGVLHDATVHQRAYTEQQLGETARALSLAVDGEILQRQAVLRTLAASGALQSGDIEGFSAQARASPAGAESWIVLLDPRGRILLDTQAGEQSSRTMPNPRVRATSWADLTQRKEHISGLVEGRTSYLIRLDRLVEIKGRPAYQLAMMMRADALQNLFARQDLPRSWYGGVVNADGVLIARNKEAWRVVGSLAGDALLRRLRTAPEGVFESQARDGIPTLTAYSRSAQTGWTVAVGVPRAEAMDDLFRSLKSLLIAGAALLLTGGGLTLWLVRSVARAVRNLEALADDLGEGRAVSPATTGLRETDFIAAALAASAERLKARESEMHRINETLEARVQEASAELVQSHKIEAIGRLTGGIAHDFNNLLTAVIGNLELLRRKITDERQLQFIHNARSAADRGAKLTAQLLAFARKQTLTREAVDVNAMICGMGELLAGALDPGRHIETDLDPGAPLAMADRTQLEMVLLNLVINARDASPEHGAVRVSTGFEHVEGPPARPEHPPAGRFVRITVADDGTGMTPEVLDRVLEPFFTTKPPGRGSGLGLPQALGVSQQLGGGLRIESDPGKGSRVHVYLPAATPEPAAPASAPSAGRRRRALAR